MDIEQNYTCECEHSPYPSASKWKAFFTYLIRKGKYYFRADSSAICTKCGTHIRTPKFYRSPLFSLVYGSAVFLINIGVCLPLLNTSVEGILIWGLYTLAWFLFDRVFIAAIFAFGKWPIDEDMGNCSGKDAFWSNNRLFYGCVFGQFARLLMRFVL